MRKGDRTLDTLTGRHGVLLNDGESVPTWGHPGKVEKHYLIDLGDGISVSRAEQALRPIHRHR